VEWRSAISKLPGNPGVYLFKDDEGRGETQGLLVKRILPASRWMKRKASSLPLHGGD
jgi:hypothetical protein